MMHSSTNRLTWHGGIIPQDEIWIKLGGDKGGDTMKVSFQIVNVATPNSVKKQWCFVPLQQWIRWPTSTLLWTDTAIRSKSCKQQSGGTHVNVPLHALFTLLHIFKIITTFTHVIFRGKNIRLFLAGDYEFLSRIYRITGAQGIIKLISHLSHT